MTNKKIPPEDLLDPQQRSTLDGLLEMVIPKSKDGKMPGVNEIGFHEFIIESPVKSISRDSPHVELSLFFSPRT